METYLLITAFLILQALVIFFSYLMELTDSLGSFFSTFIMLIISVIGITFIATDISTVAGLPLALKLILAFVFLLLTISNYLFGRSMQRQMRLRYEGIRDDLQLLKK